MAKNDLLEDILDDLSVIKSKEEATDSRLASIESTLKTLTQKLDAVKSAPSGLSETKVTIPYGTLKDAVYDGMADYYKNQPDHTGILTESNIKLIHDVTTKADHEVLSEHWEKEDEEAKKKDELQNQRLTTLGVLTVPMVAEWAPEYSPEVQRVISCLGRNFLSEDDDTESAHKILKLWGDAISVISNQASKPPTLKAWGLYKWKKIRNFLHNRTGLAYLVMSALCMAIILCINIYQSAVMDLDRTNRIFYRNVIRNEKRSKDYHELDSLIHSNSFFKTYRTLDQ